MMKNLRIIIPVLLMILILGGCSSARASNITSTEAPSTLSNIKYKGNIFIRSVTDTSSSQTVYTASSNGQIHALTYDITLKEGTYTLLLDYRAQESKLSHYSNGQPVYDRVTIRNNAPIPMSVTVKGGKNYELSASLFLGSISFNIAEINKTGSN